MNESKQRRQIQKFLKGNFKIDVDAFCIYQWVERCHVQKWWGMGVALAAHVPPDTLDSNYQKRLAFILNECRNNFEAEQKNEVQSSKLVNTQYNNINYEFPTNRKETSPIHYINYLVYEENVQYFDEVARKLSAKFHDGNLKKSKQLLYHHSRHRGIKLK